MYLLFNQIEIIDYEQVLKKIITAQIVLFNYRFHKLKNKKLFEHERAEV